MSVISTTEFHSGKKTPCDLILCIYNKEYHFTNYESLANPLFWLKIYRENNVQTATSAEKRKEVINIIKQFFTSYNLKPLNIFLVFPMIHFNIDTEKFQKDFENVIKNVENLTQTQKSKLIIRYGNIEGITPKDVLAFSTKGELKTVIERQQKQETLDELINKSSLFNMFYNFLHTSISMKIHNTGIGIGLDQFKETWDNTENKDDISIIFSGGFNRSILIKTRLSKTNRNTLYTHFNASADVCDILEGHWPIKLKSEPVTNRLYGLELECTTDYKIKDLMDAQDELFMVGKQDGSISGSKKLKIELVTVPMTLKAHKAQWSKWFTKLDYEKFDTTKKTTNGIHIHIDRKGFHDTQHMKNFAWFFGNPSNKQFLTEFSERDPSTLSHYTNFPDITTSSKKLEVYKRIQSYFPSKYFVVNFQKSKTIEVRLFKGIVSLAEIIKNLEFVDSVVEFTSMEKGPHHLTLKEYIRFLNGLPENKYQVLKEYIFKKMENLKNTLEVSEIKEIVFLETNPQRITEIINKENLLKKGINGFKLADILNKNMGKRVRIFNFDKEKGTIGVVHKYTEGSKLEGINSDVAKRFSTRTSTVNF